MSIVTPRDLPSENTNGLTAEDLIEHYNSLTLQNEKIKFKNMFLNGLHITPSRIAMQELGSGTLSVSGWYTIAETDILSYVGRTANFSIGVIGSGRGAEWTFGVTCSTGTVARTTSNTTIEILSMSSNGTSFVSGIKGLRVAKSDSISNSGLKVQAYLDPSPTITAYFQITQNHSYSGAGFFLVTPYLDNTPILPDGVTVATFLEAGAELSFDSRTSARASNRLSTLASSADQLRCSVVWDEIPKQGTGITITNANVIFRDLDNNSKSTVDISTATVTDLSFNGKEVSFSLNLVGIATGLNTYQPLFFYIITGSFKLTITG